MIDIAVTGASGAVGGRVARRLADRGVAVRLIVRDASRALNLSQADVATASYLNRCEHFSKENVEAPRTRPRGELASISTPQAIVMDPLTSTGC
jgi:nucleoside-diphosphate-sugar epimerase